MTYRIEFDSDHAHDMHGTQATTHEAAAILRRIPELEAKHETLKQALEQIAMAAEATVCNPAWIAKHARAALATPAQAQQSIDAEALIRAVLPGGSSCDPQTVADEIRRYLGQWPGQASTFAEIIEAASPTPPAQQGEKS